MAIAVPPPASDTDDTDVDVDFPPVTLPPSSVSSEGPEHDTYGTFEV